MLLKVLRDTFVLGFILSSASVACQVALDDSPTRPVTEGPTNVPRSGQVRGPGDLNPPTVLSLDSVITIGDIDSEDPLKKIERLQPLADYLAENLEEFGIQKGDVVIGRNIEDMAKLVGDGTVDIYMDSAFPSLQVQKISGSTVVARRWKQNTSDYWSIFVARRDSGIDSEDDFLGKVVAFEEPYSTSGFVLPAGMLVDRGLTITEVSRPEVPVKPDEIGYFFTLEEENTFELVFRGQVAGGGVSNQDFDKLDEERKAELVAFGRTISVPRQFVSVRPGLDAEMTQTIVDLLVGLEHFERGQRILESIRRTTRFDALPPESETAIAELERLIDLVVD